MTNVRLLIVGLILVLSAASLLTANVSAVKNLNSSKSNIYKVTANSFEPIQSKIEQIKQQDPSVKRIKVDCVVTTEPFTISCTITWQKTQSGLGTGEATTKSNTNDIMSQNKSK